MIAATAIGPMPETVSAEAAARCPARHASSLRNVDGMRMPANRFLGNRPAAATRPSATMTTPLNPNFTAPDTHVTLQREVSRNSHSRCLAAQPPKGPPNDAHAICTAWNWGEFRPTLRSSTPNLYAHGSRTDRARIAHGSRTDRARIAHGSRTDRARIAHGSRRAQRGIMGHCPSARPVDLCSNRVKVRFSINSSSANCPQIGKACDIDSIKNFYGSSVLGDLLGGCRAE